MKKRRIVNFVLATCLILGLVGCGNGTKDKNKEVTESNDIASEVRTEIEKSTETDITTEEEAAIEDKVADSIDEIPEDYLKNLKFVAGKVLDNKVRRDDCICTNPKLKEEMYEADDWDCHRNFASYKLIGMTVTPCHWEGDRQIFALLYELHFTAHTDVKTYVVMYYFNIHNTKKIVNDVTCHIEGGTTAVGDLKYIGYSSKDEIEPSLQKKWKVDTPIEFETVDSDEVTSTELIPSKNVRSAKNDTAGSGIKKEEFEKKLGVSFEVPNGINGLKYDVIEGEELIGEVTFTKDKLDYTLRMKKGERPDHKLAGLQLDYDNWEYCYDAENETSYAGIMNGYDSDKTYNLAYFYFKDINYLYTLTVTTGDHEIVDIEYLALSFCDAHWKRVQEDIDNFSGITADKLPDGRYGSYGTYVKDISENDGMLYITFEKVFYYDGKIDGAPKDDWGRQFIPDIQFTGNSNEIECGKIDAGRDFEPNSDLESVKKSIENEMKYDDGGSGIEFEIKGGKIVKLWMVYS